MHHSTLRRIAPLLVLVSALACASGPGGRRGPRPVLYPNAAYQKAGAEQAEGDIATCMYRADQGAPQENVAKNTAINTVGGAAGGAALGAVGGAIAGNAGTGAAAGAAVGATAGLLKSAYDASKPSESYKGYVNACLRDKGYEVIGWQ
jgi:hypothetical protein